MINVRIHSQLYIYDFFKFIFRCSVANKIIRNKEHLKINLRKP